MEIPFDLLGGVHSLVGLLTETTRYAADHGGNAFAIPTRLPLYDGSIADNATTVVRVRAEAAHKARLDDFASYEAAERRAAKFLRDSVDEVWYNNLKDADTFYTKVSALDIMAFLDANSGGVHAVDMISLCTNMHGYYAQADGIPQYINMLEDAQKKANAGWHAHRRRQARDDGLGGCSGGATLFPRSRRLGGPTLGLAHVAGLEKGIPPCPPETPAADFGFGGGRAARRCSWGAIGGVAGDRTVQEGTRQPCACGDKLHGRSSAAHGGQFSAHGHHRYAHRSQQDIGGRGGATPGTPAGTSGGRSNKATTKPHPGKYCWTHGHRISKSHTSATCANKGTGHCDDGTAANTYGGSEKDKGWDSSGT
jgi:hypothetical protein